MHEDRGGGHEERGVDMRTEGVGHEDRGVDMRTERWA